MRRVRARVPGRGRLTSPGSRTTRTTPAARRIEEGTAAPGPGTQCRIEDTHSASMQRGPDLPPLPPITVSLDAQGPTASAAVRGLVAAVGLGALLVAIALSPGLVERLLSPGASFDARDLACIESVRVISAALGVILLLLAGAWSRVFSHISGLDTLLFFVPIATFLAIVWSKIVFFGADPPQYRWFVREDSLAEWATWASYFTAALLALPAARAFAARREILPASLVALLGAALFFVAMEEISWGQRLFGIETPEALAENVQGELTLHNLPKAQHYLHRAYIAVGLAGGLGWLLAPGFWRLPRLRWIAGLIPPWTLAPWFLPVSVVYLVYETATQRTGTDGQEFFGCFTWGDQELVELLLATGFLLYLAYLAYPAYLAPLARVRGVSQGPGAGAGICSGTTHG